MKNLITFFFSILLLQNIGAQTPQILHKEESPIGIPDNFGKNNSEKTAPKIRFKDTIQNVILINKENVFTDGFNFIIDIPIVPEKNAIGIFVNDENIPIELFFDKKSFLSGQNEIFIFMPDWKFRKEIIEEQKRTGLHIKADRKIVYHIKRNNVDYNVDTLVLKDNPQFIFKNPEIRESKFYFYDGYGSVCCPKDKRWASYEAVQNKIKLFEKQHNLIIPKISNSFGEEGEHSTTYDLDELTTEQKFLFIKEIKSHEKGQFPQIYLPTIIEL